MAPVLALIDVKSLLALGPLRDGGRGQLLSREGRAIGTLGAKAMDLVVGAVNALPGLLSRLDEQATTIARLTRERDENRALGGRIADEWRERYARLEQRFTELAASESNRALRARVAELTRERDEARARERKHLVSWLRAVMDAHEQNGEPTRFAEVESIIDAIERGEPDA